MKKLTLFLSLFFFGNLLLAQNQLSDARLKGISAELEKVLGTWDAPSFAVAVVDKNKVVYAKGFGYRDYENKTHATANTLYAIGSCSKAFTASMLGILEGEGKLKLTDSPRKHIPELAFYNDEMNNQITIKDLMCHRTGLPRHDYSWYLFSTQDRNELVKRIAYQEPFAGVRETWYYNNFMYLLQGVIAERITGKSWEENVQEKFFDQIGMTTATPYISGMTKSKNAALGYATDKEGNIEKLDYYDIAAMSPAGSINSSVNDMAEWLKVWIHGGKYGEKEIIPTSFVDQAMTPQMVMRGGAPGKKRPELHFSTYGYAWMCSSYKGHYRVEHGGNIDGFSANTCFFPSDSIGIVVLTNQNSSSIPSVVRNIVADRMLGVDITDWNTDLYEERQEGRDKQKESEKEEDTNKKTGTKPSHNMFEYAGIYSNPGYGEFELVVERDSMFILFPLKKYWLRHYHYDVFEPFEVEEDGIDTSEPSELKLAFGTNELGDISVADMKIEVALDHPINFKRKPKAIEMEKGALEKYVGDYDLMGMVAKVYTKGETLFVFIAGQPEYELIATGEHKFSIKILDGYKLEFHDKDGGGEIESLSFIQPNGTFKAVKK